LMLLQLGGSQPMEQVQKESWQDVEVDTQSLTRP
jgi:hypothetical protein